MNYRDFTINKRQQAFTLIEILVVISIITVLLAISLPVLSRIRSEAKRVLCAANCHQIGLAWDDYLTDNKEYYPQGIDNIHYTFGGWPGPRPPG